MMIWGDQGCVAMAWQLFHSLFRDKVSFKTVQNPDFLFGNPDLLFRNPDLQIRNLDFLLKNVEFTI